MKNFKCKLKNVQTNVKQCVVDRSDTLYKKSLFLNSGIPYIFLKKENSTTIYKRSFFYIDKNRNFYKYFLYSSKKEISKQSKFIQKKSCSFYSKSISHSLFVNWFSFSIQINFFSILKQPLFFVFQEIFVLFMLILLLFLLFFLPKDPDRYEKDHD